MKAIHYIFIVILIAITLGMIHNANSLQPYAQINQPINLMFLCTLNNQVPPTGTTFNVTISNSSNILINNKATASQGNGNFNYTYTFNSLGTYRVDEFCYTNGYNFSTTEYITVTTSGDSLSSGSSLLYVILIIISFGLFAFFIILGYKLDGENHKDEDGIVNVNNQKYLKMGCFFFAYIIATWLFFNLYTVSNNYLQQNFMTNFFWFGWVFLGWGLVVIIPAYFIFNVVWLYVDSKFQKLFMQNIPALESY